MVKVVKKKLVSFWEEEMKDRKLDEWDDDEGVFLE